MTNSISPNINDPYWDQLDAPIHTGVFPAMSVNYDKKFLEVFNTQAENRQWVKGKIDFDKHYSPRKDPSLKVFKWVRDDNGNLTLLMDPEDAKKTGVLYVENDESNNTPYVGITTRTIFERMEEHKNDSLSGKFSCPHRDAAFAKRPEQFTVRIVAHNLDKKDLVIGEPLLIEHYPKSYNLTKGGDGVILDPQELKKRRGDFVQNMVTDCNYDNRLKRKVRKQVESDVKENQAKKTASAKINPIDMYDDGMKNVLQDITNQPIKRKLFD